MTAARVFLGYQLSVLPIHLANQSRQCIEGISRTFWALKISTLLFQWYEKRSAV